MAQFIRAVVDTSDFERKLRQLHAHARDLREPLRRLRRDMVADQIDHQRKRQGPNGAWKALASSTRERRSRGRKRGARALLGALPVSGNISVSKNALTFRSRVPWSMAHLAGGLTGHGARMPRREYWWVSKKLIRRTERELTSYLVRRWNSGP